MSNESMANYLADVPSEIAELLAVNKQLEQELQETREQLEKAEELLRTVIESAESLMTLGDRYTEHGQNIVDARQYFKDKQGE